MLRSSSVSKDTEAVSMRAFISRQKFSNCSDKSPDSIVGRGFSRIFITECDVNTSMGTGQDCVSAQGVCIAVSGRIGAIELE